MTTDAAVAGEPTLDPAVPPRTLVDGVDVTRNGAQDMIKSGLSHVLQGHSVFKEMTVAENVGLGAYTVRDKALIAEVTVFDVFAGPRAEAQMWEGRKSLAIAVRLQPTSATLTEAEIEAVSRKVVASVERATGGTLRS